jgi:hypothetical protein
VGGELIAREHDLVEIAVALHSGAGSLVSGDAGVGKTALVSAAIDRLTSAGGSVARIVATAASRSMPFGGVAPLLPNDLGGDLPAGQADDELGPEPVHHVVPAVGQEDEGRSARSGCCAVSSRRTTSSSTGTSAAGRFCGGM